MTALKDETETLSETETISARRNQMLQPLSIVGVCCFTPFFIYNLVSGNYILCAAVLGVTLIFFFNGYAIYRRKKPPIPFEVLLIPSVFAIVVSIIYQGVFGTYWCYPL